MKVSVIVPVYNVEEYLERCLETLVNQTLEEIEIIVVNDGSRDCSQQIIDQFENKYPDKIVSLSKKNGGLSDARNFGLPYARGEYIGFIDSDDYVDLNMYELLYRKATQTNADIVECNLHHTYKNYEDTEKIVQYSDKEELIAFGCSVAWNKIYKREWLLKTGVVFPKGINHEDIDFFCLLVPYANKIEYIDDACVHYVQREGSINNLRSEKLLDIHKIFSHLTVEYKKRNLWNSYGMALEALAIRVLLGSALTRFCKISDKKIRKNCISQNWNCLNSTFPDWRNNILIKKQRGLRIIYYKYCNHFIYRMISAILIFKERIL